MTLSKMTLSFIKFMHVLKMYHEMNLSLNSNESTGGREGVTGSGYHTNLKWNYNEMNTFEKLSSYEKDKGSYSNKQRQEEKEISIWYRKFEMVKKCSVSKLSQVKEWNEKKIFR